MAEDIDLDGILESVGEWPPRHREAFAKACWLGTPAEALRWAHVNDLPDKSVEQMLDFVSRQEDRHTVCAQDPATLEDEINWRPGDSEFMNDLRADGNGFFVRLSLLVLDRCSYSQAEVLVPYLASKVANLHVQLSPVSLAEVVDDLRQGRDVAYLVRYRDLIWKVQFPMQSPTTPSLSSPSGDALNLQDIDQFWRVLPDRA